jgi:hypothetical protein
MVCQGIVTGKPQGTATREQGEAGCGTEDEQEGEVEVEGFHGVSCELITFTVVVRLERRFSDIAGQSQTEPD